MTRPTWDEWALGLAKAVATRADCTRRQVGAVILDVENRVVSTGYNGAYPGGPSCLAGECPRGRHHHDPHRELRGTTGWGWCACGEAWPCGAAADPGSSYDTGPGTCVAVHAEGNAILFADRARLDGATLYVSDRPCGGCMRMVQSTKIRVVKWPDGELEL